MKKQIKNFFASIGSFYQRIKPNWFQWNFPPKDGQPPTLSIIECSVYLLVLWYSFGLFRDFNRIPVNKIGIEAHKFGQIRTLTRTSVNDSTFDLNYVTAYLNISFPMSELETENGSYKASFFNSTKRIVAPIDDQYKYRWLETNLSPYWYAVLRKATMINFGADIRTKHMEEPIFHDGFDVSKSYLEMDSISIFAKNGYDVLQKKIPDPLANVMRNYYWIRFSSNVIDDKVSIAADRLSWKARPMEENIYFKRRNNNQEEVVKYEVFNIQRENVQKVGDETYINWDLCEANNQSNVLYAEMPNGSRLPYYQSSVVLDLDESEDNSKRKVAWESPKWWDRYDISQGRYHISLNTATIDSVSLTIDFLGPTDFYTLNIEPDEKGSNYIKFTDQMKILRIKQDGLNFYAKFKELENRQAVRCFFVTTFLSGLIIIMLTFLIVGVYRTIKTLLK